VPAWLYCCDQQIDSTIAILGLLFLGLFVAKSDFSRAATLAIFAIGVVVPIPLS
jgi:hypothetical protein